MSTLKADTVQSTSGGAATLTKQHAAKAWIRFNGTGTVAINDSFNVASLTDDGTGDYHYNYTNSMSDGNHAQLALSGTGVVTDDIVTASLANIGTFNTAGTATDSSRTCAGTHGDLA